MKVFEISRQEGVKPLEVVGIDPGVATQGIAHFKVESDVYHWEQQSLECDLRVTWLSMPELIVAVQDRVRETLKVLDRMAVSIPETAVVIEYPFMRGSASPGIGCYTTELVNQLMDRGVARIGFLPCRIPEFFLKKRSVSGLETVALVKTLFPDVGRIKVHAADAMLFALFRYYEYFVRYVRGLDQWRPPNFKIVNILPSYNPSWVPLPSSRVLTAQ